MNSLLGIIKSKDIVKNDQSDSVSESTTRVSAVSVIATSITPLLSSLEPFIKGGSSTASAISDEEIINIVTENSVEHNAEFWDHQITFEVPSNLDLEKIKHLDNFTTLLHGRTGTGLNDLNGPRIGLEFAPPFSDLSDFGDFDSGRSDSNIHPDLNGFLNIFGKVSNSDNVDYQIILNYLWIGVVTSLVIMSVIFLVFSCYFYRKFREWKKCNKDIRLQLPNDLYPAVVTPSENGYYQMESPPCYTIATGLPSYDEAMVQAHFAFGMRFYQHPWDCSSGGIWKQHQRHSIRGHVPLHYGQQQYFFAQQQPGEFRESTVSATVGRSTELISNGIEIAKTPKIVNSSNTAPFTVDSKLEELSLSSSKAGKTKGYHRTSEGVNDVEGQHNGTITNSLEGSSDCLEVIVKS